VQHVLQDAEGTLINNIQNAFGRDNTGLKIFMRIPLYLVRPQITCLFMCFLYLSTDSLIAFKVRIHFGMTSVELNFNLLRAVSHHLPEDAL
jgi:hypothetical protein